MSGSDAVERIFSLYRNHGSDDYIGEKVTQLEHAIQCAMQAEQEGYNNEVCLNPIYEFYQKFLTIICFKNQIICYVFVLGILYVSQYIFIYL